MNSTPPNVRGPELSVQRPVAPIDAKLTELGHGLDQLHKEIALLRERLDPVLGADRPMPAEASDLVERGDGTSRVATILDDLVGHATAMRREVSGLTERVEA